MKIDRTRIAEIKKYTIYFIKRKIILIISLHHSEKNVNYSSNENIDE